MKGYQFLENDFFELCETRKIGRIYMLLYIYLRGLYCRFQKPVFFWADKTARDHLSISQSTLLRARKYLKERGLIEFESGLGAQPTQYTMLGTVLLPVVKMTIRCRHTPVQGCRQIDDTNNTTKERLKNQVGIFQGTTKEEKESLKAKGLL